MAWEGSDRRERLPDDWPKRRLRRLRQDGYRCQARGALPPYTDTDAPICGRPANQVDHVIPGDDHDHENLRSLCRWHHGRKSAAEGVAARGPRPTRRREPEPHPGLLPYTD